MKVAISILTAIAFTVIVYSCKNSPEERYFDLSSGKVVDPEKNATSGIMVDKKTGQPLYIYVDSKNHDTILGATGKVINGHVLVLGDDKKYVYDGDEKLVIESDGSMKYKDGDYKVEIEKDGDMTTKNGDKKVKVDGKTDEKKVKKD